MKITKSQLKKIIKEEISKALSEAEGIPTTSGECPEGNVANIKVSTMAAEPAIGSFSIKACIAGEVWEYSLPWPTKVDVTKWFYDEGAHTMLNHYWKKAHGTPMPADEVNINVYKSRAV